MIGVGLGRLLGGELGINLKMGVGWYVLKLRVKVVLYICIYKLLLLE